MSGFEWGGVKAWPFDNPDDGHLGIEIANTKTDGISVSVFIKDSEPVGVVIDDGQRAVHAWGWLPVGTEVPS